MRDVSFALTDPESCLNLPVSPFVTCDPGYGTVINGGGIHLREIDIDCAHPLCKELTATNFRGEFIAP